jgi:hypothetical protein
MRLGGRRSGTITLFIDASSNEVVLKLQADPSGCTLVGFTLYDAVGRLVIDSPEPRSFPDGLTVTAADEEILLELPPDPDTHITYRLYSNSGRLLTVSDGKRTQVFNTLRMSGQSTISAVRNKSA